MNSVLVAWITAAGLMLGLGLAGTGWAQGLPVVKGKRVVATVAGEPITLDEFNLQVAALQRDPAPGAPAARLDREAQVALLNRLVRLALIAQEARRMQLDKLPEVRKMLDAFARVALREELVERVVKDVKADPREVEALYRPAVTQWKVSAALFASEEHARSLAAEVAAGKDFREASQAAVAAGRATRLDEGVGLRRGTAEPQIGQALATMAVGAVSPVVATKSGPVVLKLEEIQYPDDPAEKAKAELIVLTGKRKEAVAAFDQALRKKYVRLNGELLKSLDFESDTPGMAALLKDGRVLAEIKGEKPVTVADLAEELKFQFFHGPTLAAERKRLNAKKEQLLEGLLHRKVFRKEALRLGLDRTDAYRFKVKDHETSVLFDAFIRKAIAPDLKLAEDEVKQYYQEHRDQYTMPEMVRLRSLAFDAHGGAEAAADLLKKGADLQWVASRAEGQVEAGAKDLLVFDGKPIMTSELPEGLQKAVAGARAGDVRLYASPERHYYALVVQDVVAARPQPYEQVRKEILDKVVGLKIQKAVDNYTDKLRALSDVKTYLKAS